ncbi:MAG: DMT family transporter, partial [Paracoccaceae bacterium]|nr:DMT family transporter [Paracoccaceae bacterium]
VISGPALLRGFDPTSVAQLAMLCAAISYGFAALWARLHLSALAPQVAAAGMTTMSALMIAVLALWVEGAPTFAYSPRAWVSLAYMAVIGTAAAYLLYYRILAMAGSGNLSLVTLLVAPIAVIIGAVVLDEVMAPRVYAGLFLLTLGLIALDGRLLRLRRQN